MKKTSTERVRKFRRSKFGVVSTIYHTLKVDNVREGYYVEMCTKEEFVEWALGHPEFVRLWDEYIDNGRQQNTKPSIIRVSPVGPYVPLNLEWYTRREVKSITTKERSRRCGF